MHWVTYRRAPLAVPAALPVITAVTYAGRTRQVAWAGETVQLKDYGQARQITLFEHGRVALQILTSDFGACPADILSWLKSRWREENFLKYASENYGIDKICDYLASIGTNTKLIRNPARDQANAAVRDADKTLAAAERGLAALLADPGLAPAAKNARIPACRRTSPAPAPRRPPRSRPASPSPRNCPPATSTPTRKPRCCAPAGAACRWSCGSSPTTPSTGYRATSTPTSVTTTSTAPSPARPSSAAWPAPSPGPPPRSPSPSTSQAPPASPRALALLINATPPAMPGDSRPITCHLAPRPAI